MESIRRPIIGRQDSDPRLAAGFFVEPTVFADQEKNIHVKLRQTGI
jgi:hypothetical protein